MLIVIAILLLLLLMLPVGADGAYSEQEPGLWARVGPVRVAVYPRKKKPPKDKPAPTPQEQAPKPKKKLPDVTKDEVLEAVTVLVRSVGKLRFRLHRLKLHFISAFPDPYQTAMVFGYASAAVSALGLDRLRQGDVQIGVDFERDRFYVDGYLSVTIRIYYIVKLGLCLAWGLVPILWRRHKRLKPNKPQIAAGKEA